MKFRCRVTYQEDATGEKAWWEEYEKDTKDPEEWAKDTIEYFNSTLRPHEKPRRLIGVEVIDTDAIKDHAWTKSSLTTVSHAGKYFDRMKCTRCGITGKRYNLKNVQIDSKFRRKAFQRCDTSLEFIKKNGMPE